MGFIFAIPNGQVLFTILVIGVIGLFVTSIGAVLGIWTWKTPQSIAVLIVGVVLIFFVANYTLASSLFG